MGEGGGGRAAARCSRDRVARSAGSPSATQLAGRNAPLGLHLDAGERIDDIAADLAHFSLIALAFPKFSDGRAFSTARLLREKHGYAGELRAVGNVLSDQIPLMRRVGFDSLRGDARPDPPRARARAASPRSPCTTSRPAPTSRPPAPAPGIGAPVA